MSKVLKFKIVFIIFFQLFVSFCGKKEKVEEILLNPDDNLVFSTVKIKRVFKKNYFMEIDLIPYENGLIIGRQKNSNGNIEKYDFSGNLILKKDLDIGTGMDKIKHLAGCFYDIHAKNIYEFSFPYVKEFSDDLDSTGNISRMNLKYPQLGVGIKLYSPPVSLTNDKTNHLFRFIDYNLSKHSSKSWQRNYGLCESSKDFKHFKKLISFFTTGNINKVSKIIMNNYYSHKEWAYFPVTFDKKNKKIFILKSIWIPEFYQIDLLSKEKKRFIVDLKNQSYSDSDIIELNNFYKWYMDEVYPKRLYRILKGKGYKFINKIPETTPFFENILLYKQYLLLFSGAKDFKADTTTVYVFDKDSIKYLGKMNFPYSGDYYNNSFIFKDYYIDVSMKYDTEDTVFEVNVYKLEI